MGFCCPEKTRQNCTSVKGAKMILLWCFGRTGSLRSHIKIYHVCISYPTSRWGSWKCTEVVATTTMIIMIFWVLLEFFESGCTTAHRPHRRSLPPFDSVNTLICSGHLIPQLWLPCGWAANAEKRKESGQWLAHGNLWVMSWLPKFPAIVKCSMSQSCRVTWLNWGI